MDVTTKRLYQLAFQPGAVVRLADLPRIWGLSDAEAAVVLAGLVDARELQLWPERKAVVLAPAAADRLNLEIVADRRNRPVWHTRGTHSAERAKRLAGITGDDIASADVPPAKRRNKKPAVFLDADIRSDEGSSLFDDLPGPTQEELADWGYPTWVMGLGLIWTGPSIEPKRGEKCKGCGHHRKMPTIAYCAICNRSGNRKVRMAIPPEPIAPSLPTSNQSLAGGIGERVKKGRKLHENLAVKIAK